MMLKVKQAMHMGQAELSFTAMKVEPKCRVQGVALSNFAHSKLSSQTKQCNNRLFSLAVPLRREGQLYRWPRHSLTNSSTLLKNTTIEHSERLVTLETCDKSDEET